MTTNPLQKYFRQPGRSIILPSRGIYNAEGDIEFELNGEVKILPMTNQDAINLSNPDNLLNGSAIKDLIKSCCPNIKNVDNLCMVDSDAILVAIKMVSSSNLYTMKMECPHCKKENNISVSLSNLLDTMKPLPEALYIRLNDTLVVNLKPYVLKDFTILSIHEYQENFTYKMIQTSNISEEQKVKALTESLMKIVKLETELLPNVITSIVTPEEEVTDKNFIKEFLQNVPNNFVQKIKDKMKEISKLGISDIIPHKCEHCDKEFEVPFMFNPASFLD